MRTPFVAGNWKMNGTQKQNEHLLRAIKHYVESTAHPVCRIALLPPALYLAQVRHHLAGTSVQWGLQNVYFASSGAYTGEHSAIMAKDMNCTYCLVGHSERRTHFLESNDDIAKKTHYLLKENVTPILCVGETLEQRYAEKTQEIIEQQLSIVIKTLPNLNNLTIVVAYEPFWAIGTGQSATPTQVQEVHFFIRRLLQRFNAELSERTRLLYGGSINEKNARALFAQKDIDGGLVGGASLQADQFITICEATG